MIEDVEKYRNVDYEKQIAELTKRIEYLEMFAPKPFKYNHEPFSETVPTENKLIL